MTNKPADRFKGFCLDYDKYRPQPPEIIFSLGRKLVGETPELVVDLGSGSGLSTSPWSPFAKLIIGIEPSDEMLEVARRERGGPNIFYRKGFGNKTGIDSESVDIVAASSSLHWMEPQSTLNEIDRILRKEGLLIVYGHYYPVYSDSYVLTNLHEIWRANLDHLEYKKEKPIATKYSSADVLRTFKESEVFSYSRKLYVHSELSWTAEEIVGFMNAHAGIPFLRNKGYGDSDLYFTPVHSELSKILVDFKFSVLFTYSISIFIK